MAALNDSIRFSDLMARLATLDFELREETESADLYYVVDRRAGKRASIAQTLEDLAAWIDDEERRRATVPAISDARAWRRGADLAIEMLDELEERSQDDVFVLDPTNRGSRPQDNIVLRYLNRARDTNDSRCIVAFCAVLTDFVASGCDGVIPDAALLESLSRHPIATTAEVRHE